jgi:hypothetical protein
VEPAECPRNKELTFTVDMGKRGRTEVIFYMAQPPLPTEINDQEFDRLLGSHQAPEIGRTIHDGTKPDLVWTRNLRDTAVNAGEVAFYARVGSDFSRDREGRIKTGVRVTMRPADPGPREVLYVNPPVAKLELFPGSPKGTELVFEVDMINHKSHRAEVIIYMAQPPLPTEVSDRQFDEYLGSKRAPSIGRAYTNDGYLLWTWQIRQPNLDVNRGEIAFYAKVGSSSPKSENRNPVIYNPTGGIKVGTRIRVE